MASTETVSTRSSTMDGALLLLRVVFGVLLIMHGVHKIIHPGVLGFIGGQLSAHHLPTFVAYGVYIGEVVGPALIIAGMFTRLGGIFVAINMLMTIVLVHAAEISNMGLLNDGGAIRIELQLLYMVLGIFFIIVGSGRFALSRGVGALD